MARLLRLTCVSPSGATTKTWICVDKHAALLLEVKQEPTRWEMAPPDGQIHFKNRLHLYSAFQHHHGATTQNQWISVPVGPSCGKTCDLHYHMLTI